MSRMRRKGQKKVIRSIITVLVVIVFSFSFHIPPADAAQFARPTTDVSIGSWTGSPTNTTGNRYQNIDESTASDSDYVRSPSNPSNSAAEFGLGSITDPVSSSGHIVRVRARQQESGGGGPGNTTITIQLKQGSTVIASSQFSHGNNDYAYYDRSFTLTSGEADSITDYSDLRLNFIANKTSGSRSPWVEVTWAEFEVPDAVTGSLTVDIVDSGGSSVSSPSTALNTTTFSWSAQTTTGTFGTASEKVRVSNTTATPTWTLSIAASDPETQWNDGAFNYDFNDPTANASDGGDADNYGGQLTVDPSISTITPQGGCSTTGLTKGSSTGFSEGVTDSLTLITAGATADTNCYWDFTGFGLSQTIPAEQNASSNYNINFTVSVVAS